MRRNKALEVIAVKVRDFNHSALLQRLLEHLLIPALQPLPPRCLLFARVAVEDVIRASRGRACPNVRTYEATLLNIREVSDENLVVHWGAQPTRLKERNAVDVAVIACVCACARERYRHAREGPKGEGVYTRTRAAKRGWKGAAQVTHKKKRNARNIDNPLIAERHRTVLLSALLAIPAILLNVGAEDENVRSVVLLEEHERALSVRHAGHICLRPALSRT